MKDFKYKTTFRSEAKITRAKKEEKESFASFCATAADLSGLKSLLPSREEAESNPDLLFCSFNLAVANQINLNHDGMLGPDVVALAKNAKYKQINVEHDREKGAIGVITGTAFSEFGTNKLISEEEALAKKEPFNLVVTAAIWRVMSSVDKILEQCSDPDSEDYMSVSASWEVMFNEFVIAKGSRNLSLAQIIDDDQDVFRMEAMLKASGGEGTDETGTELYRVIKGGTITGAGLTRSPAAQVQGVLTLSLAEEEPEATVDPEKEILREKIREILEVILAEKEESSAKVIEVIPAPVLEIAASQNIEQKTKKIISLNKTSPVTINRTSSTMKVNKQVESFLEALASETPPTAIEVRQFLDKAISEANEQYLAEKESKAQAEAQSQKAVEESLATKQKLSDLEDKIKELEAFAEEQERQAIFDARISTLSETYDLSDKKVSALVARQIKDLDEEGFNYWKSEDGQVILAGKEKNKAKVDVEAATDALKTATASVTDIPNAQDIEEEAPKSLSFEDIKLTLK